ncbi:MAG TPA: pentapeptide repeat-containing protein, partial [Bacteroidales bacterium]|nr:pentapeptide repeat-containing protein [Bacteroidales bacterium]
DLSGAVFDNCNLDRAIFQHTLLEKADFSTAYGYAIDPEVNRLKQARFSSTGLNGLLYKYDLEIID